MALPERIIAFHRLIEKIQLFLGFIYREMNFPIDFTLTKCYDELVIEKGGDKAAARA